MKKINRIVTVLLVSVIFVTNTISANALEVGAPSVVLMEASTGKVIFEKDAYTKRSPASVTKVMTLLLIFEEIEKGTIKKDDLVTTSAYAKSMGGSQVFLEEGEHQTVDTLIKCITVASGNDASVAMAEYISGTEKEFVDRMNEKASELGMNNTNFIDCCGLTDSDNHYTCAYDVAIMSQALITKYPQIFDYSTIWMEDITHTTQRGSSNFTLSSTNKLLKQYEWTTGLKTGYTSKAKFCISATAKKDEMELIAVVMGADTSQSRNADAVAMFNYGFNSSHLYVDENCDELPDLPIKGGILETVKIECGYPFRYLDIEGRDLSGITREVKVQQECKAPVKEGQVAGEVVYSLNGEWIGSVPLVYGEDVERANYLHVLKKVLLGYLL
ncbi:MAG: D-alanyl-D-alanine carboxypeptidase [Lachnospiraceae bacterium]|nr:D-alanyl-D-alanine carboxypeptidase [Lachnospiraceae bacterium]